jgi:serine-type D-Ala-D-Ala carboxypeptidase/endopeptidase (penicillin-binding protein 4)
MLRAMKKSTKIIGACIGLACLPQISHAAVNWAALLDQGEGRKIRFGALIGGKEPFARNAEEAFAPASVSKIFTASAVLHALGPNHRYTTKLSWEQLGNRATNLVLTGSGDPSWGLPQIGENLHSRLASFAKHLKESGVSELAGSPTLKVSDPRWNEPTVPEGWKEHDTLSCGGSLALGFNLGLNCATYKVTSAASGAWLSPGLNWKVIHKVAEGEKTSLGLKLVRIDGKLKYVLSGTFRRGDAPRSFTLPVFETLPWAQALFRQALLEAGIRILPADSFATEPRGEFRQIHFSSPPLSELLKPFLKNSNNFLGDAFLLSLAAEGRAPGGPGLLYPGIEKLREFLTALGLPRDFVLNDGSGLSRTSRTSPRFVLEFLLRMEREPYFLVLKEALAVAGVDGTLRNRMKGTPAQGRIHAKTGTLDGVYNLAGFLPSGQENIPFVLLTRTNSDLRVPARAAGDRLGIALAELYPNLFVHELTTAPYPYLPELAGYDDQ